MVDLERGRMIALSSPLRFEDSRSSFLAGGAWNKENTWAVGVVGESNSQRNDFGELPVECIDVAL